MKGHLRTSTNEQEEKVRSWFLNRYEELEVDGYVDLVQGEKGGMGKEGR